MHKVSRHDSHTSSIGYREHNIKLVYKKIKHLRLTYNRRNGKISISVPIGLDYEVAKAFLNSKIAWLDKQLSAHPPSIAPIGYFNGEMVLLEGKSYRLCIVENEASNEISLHADTLVLQSNASLPHHIRLAIIESFYRNRLSGRIKLLKAHWQGIMGVQATKWSVKKMKSRWGSCNPIKRTICINLELAKLSDSMLEYVIVHELAHLIEPTHNKVFKSVLDSYLPDWKARKAELRSYIINF